MVILLVSFYHTKVWIRFELSNIQRPNLSQIRPPMLSSSPPRSRIGIRIPATSPSSSCASCPTNPMPSPSWMHEDALFNPEDRLMVMHMAFWELARIDGRIMAWLVGGLTLSEVEATEGILFPAGIVSIAVCRQNSGEKRWSKLKRYCQHQTWMKHFETQQ